MRRFFISLVVVAMVSGPAFAGVSKLACLEIAKDVSLGPEDLTAGTFLDFPSDSLNVSATTSLFNLFNVLSLEFGFVMRPKALGLAVGGGINLRGLAELISGLEFKLNRDVVFSFLWAKDFTNKVQMYGLNLGIRWDW